jgi:hypothetical protein
MEEGLKFIREETSLVQIPFRNKCELKTIGTLTEKKLGRLYIEAQLTTLL